MNNSFGNPSGALRWFNRRRLFDVRQVLAFGYHAIDLGATYGSGAVPTHRPWEIDIERYKALVPGVILDWSPEVARTHRPPPHYMDHPLLLDPVLEENFIPFPHGTVGQIRGWLQAELALIGRDAEANDEQFSDPERLIAAGHLLLPRPGEPEPLDSRVGAVGLALVGLGAIWFWHRTRCEVCFRLSAPGLSRCSLHSQSKFNRGDDPRDASHRAQFSRVARKAVVANTDLCQILHVGEGRATFEHAIASILWPTFAADAFFDADKVASALNAAPRVHRLLPSNFQSLSPAGQMSLLRERIDPEERVAYVWPEKIHEAERWLAAEASVAPGRQCGLSQTNMERVALIMRLLEQGFHRAEIAEQLNISRSHLSHLLRRAQGPSKR